MDTLAETILERDKKRGRWRSQSTTSRMRDAVEAQKWPAPEGKPEFKPSAALLLLDVLQRTRHRRRALQSAQIEASSVPTS